MRKEADEGNRLAIVVITHSTRLVSIMRAERVFVLGYDAKLTKIDTDSETTVLEARLKKHLNAKLVSSQDGSIARAKGQASKGKGLATDLARWLTQMPDSVYGFPAMVQKRNGRRTLGQALVLSAIRSVLYYPFIGAIFGGVFILSFAYAVPFLATKNIIAIIGAEIVLRFSPPIAAILIAACAGSTIAAWVGQMTVQRQLDALRVLGVDVGRHVLAPIWWGLSVGAVINTVTFAVGITLVMGAYVAAQSGEVEIFWEGFGVGGNKSGTIAVATALVKTLGYAALIAAVSIGSATSNAIRTQRAAAAAITHGIVWSSLLIMSVELIALASNYAE